jgi:hypothetical protein
VKIIFGVLLLISIVFPVHNVATGLEIVVHNEYEGRFTRLQSTEPTVRGPLPNGHFGLTATDLAALDREVAFAYTDAVRDAYRLGHGYSGLWQESMVLDGLLFVSSALGLWACWSRRQSPNQTMQPTAGRPDASP